jgi:hypothetical protein
MQNLLEQLAVLRAQMQRTTYSMNITGAVTAGAEKFNVARVSNSEIATGQEFNERYCAAA